VTTLLATIGGGLIAAFVGGYLARRVGLPPIVGYLAAGMAVGPFTPGFVADLHVATELAELGVILLMFGVGLHFSVRDIWAVRSIAVPGAVGQIAVATALGGGLGLALGWGLAAGIVLGLALSVASTVVLLRALTARRELDSPQGRVAVGWLIVEDLVTVLVLVLLPTAAVLVEGGANPEHPLVGVAGALAKAALLMVLVFVLGTRLLPPLLRSVAREGSRDVFTLAVLAVAIGIAYVSFAVFGVSLALGAFLAGAVLSGSDVSHKAAWDALPLQDAFAVLFFVSVGMLVDPVFLVGHPLQVLAVVLLVIVGKSITALGIVVAARHPPRVAVTVAAGLAQVGEFTFILATLGVQLGLLPSAGFQLVVAGAILSIGLNPLAFALGDRVEPMLRHALFRRSPLLAAQNDALAVAGSVHLPPGRRHAVIVGYGRVGALIGDALGRRQFGFVVIDRDLRLVERLRERGIDALYGDAADPELLERAELERAAVLVIATPEEAFNRVVQERARRLAPRLEIVVRTPGERLAARLLGEARVWPIVAPRELGAQIARVTLARYGISPPEIEAIIQGIRLDQVDDGDPPGLDPRKPLSRLLGRVRDRWSSYGAALPQFRVHLRRTSDRG
jgi:CPA2 family monovalent cation:H+ antiporter-2